MSKSGHIIKLSSNLRPYISRTVRHGRMQELFAERIGRPVGACVRGAVHRGMSGGAIKEAVRQCSTQFGLKGTHPFGGKGAVSGRVGGGGQVAYEREMRRAGYLG